MKQTKIAAFGASLFLLTVFGLANWALDGRPFAPPLMASEQQKPLVSAMVETP